MSAAAIARGIFPVAIFSLSFSPAWPSPRNTHTSSDPLFATARSGFPSPSKSAATTDTGSAPTAKCDAGWKPTFEHGREGRGDCAGTSEPKDAETIATATTTASLRDATPWRLNGLAFALNDDSQYFIVLPGKPN